MTFYDTVQSTAAAQDEFERCWRDPNCTQFALPEKDVNEILRERYLMQPQTELTRSLIWDMQCKKAVDPGTYVPYVVSDAGLRARRVLRDGTDHFVRWSTQKAWLDERRGRVIESIFIDHSSQKIIFLGIREAETDHEEMPSAVNYQPLVHVEHSTGGSKHQPYNIWRIVFLTEKKDGRYTRPFEDTARSGLLPGYLEIYIEKDLKVALSRR